MAKGEITYRQTLLYAYLKGAIDNGVDYYLNATTIARALNPRLSPSEQYEVCFDKSRNWHNPCPAISSDVEAINSTMKFDKMIMVEDNKYRLATNDGEAQKKVDWCLRKIEYYSRLMAVYKAKMRQDGQGKVVNNNDEPMTPSSKGFHETY